jgi:hypothetical protein
MADKKISALTASTTPLAGTEVLPIVQSGATVKVSVANLTAGRAVSMSDATLTGVYDQSAYAASGWIVNWNNTGASGHQMYFGYNNGTSNRIGLYIAGGPGVSNQLDLTVANKFGVYGSGGVVVGTGDPGAGNLAITNGNLAISTSGKGIDFSATPGTGTSELLADYEEGDWTPSQGSGLTVVGAFSSTGKYTKVGRLVTVQGSVNAVTSISVAVGGQITGNLPFTVSGVAYQVGSSCDSAPTTGGQLLAFNGSTAIFSCTAIGATLGIYFQVSYTV